MRAPVHAAAVVATALAGCLSAPTGQPADAAAIDAATDAALNVWPPAGINPIAIAAGNVDGDGVDDVLVLDDASDQIFLLRGGVDVEPDDELTTTYTKSATISGLNRPAAILVVDTTPPRIVVADVQAGGIRVTVLGTDLVQTGQSTLAGMPPAADDPLALQRTSFGIDMQSIWVMSKGLVGFIEASFLANPAPEIRRPMTTGATPFTSILAVGGASPPGLVFVVEPDLTQKAAIAAMTWTWSTARSTDSWYSAVAADVTGDAIPDAVGWVPVGLPVTATKVCVTDVAPVTPTNGCVQLASALPRGPVMMGDVTGMGLHDLVVLDPAPPFLGTGLFVVPDVRATGGVVMVGTSGAAQDLANVTSARATLAQLDADARQEVLIVDAVGAIRCARWNGVKTAPCAP